MARIKLRRDTLANWTTANPILDLGEPGYVTDTEQLKIGNGVDDWDTLPYFFGGFDGGTISNALIITADATATDGALELAGDCFHGDGAVGLLQVGTGLNFVDKHILASFVKNEDDYIQVIISNKSNGTAASSDLVVNNDSTAGTNIFGNFGINSTTFVGTGGPFDQPNETYVIAAGGELAIGTVDPYTVNIVSNDVSRIEIANNGEVEFQPSSPVHILNTTDSTNHETGALVIEGGLGVGKTIVCDDNIYIGPNAVNFPLTDPVLVAQQNGAGFIQTALVNENENASSDFIAYTADSTEEYGWADLGYAGTTFNDPAYTITPPGTGYVITQGLNNTTTSGSLLLGTGDRGTEKDIYFGTGGFAPTNVRMRLDHSAQTLAISMTTASTNTNSGALVVDGGVGIDGALNIGGAVNKVTITPPSTTNATLTLSSGVTLTHPLSLTFPNTSGTAGAVLTTNGSGTLSYVAQSDLPVTKLPTYSAYSTDYLATLSDNVILVDPNGVARTITLPGTAPQGKIYTIKKITTFAGPTVTVTTNNVFCTIDGSASYALNNMESVTVVMGNDGTNDVYYIIGKVV